MWDMPPQLCLVPRGGHYRGPVLRGPNPNQRARPLVRCCGAYRWPHRRGVGCATGLIRQAARAEEGFGFAGFSPQRVSVCERTVKAQLIG